MIILVSLLSGLVIDKLNYFENRPRKCEAYLMMKYWTCIHID